MFICCCTSLDDLDDLRPIPSDSSMVGGIPELDVWKVMDAQVSHSRDNVTDDVSPLAEIQCLPEDHWIFKGCVQQSACQHWNTCYAGNMERSRSPGNAFADINLFWMSQPVHHVVLQVSDLIPGEAFPEKEQNMQQNYTLPLETVVLEPKKNKEETKQITIRK